MEKNILLSICIPTYNRGGVVYPFGKELVQRKSDRVEIVVSDNCSTDNTQELLSQIDDPRFHYYRNESNIGFPNMMKAVELGKGEYCLLLGDKDILDLSAIDKILDILEKDKETAVFVGVCLAYDGSMYRAPTMRIYARNTVDAFIYAKQICMHGTALIVRRKLLEQTKRFVNPQSYLYELYPHLCYFVALMLYGNISPMKELVIKKRVKQYFVDHSAWKGVYWSITARLEQTMEWIRYFAPFPFSTGQRVEILNFLVTQQLNRVADWYLRLMDPNDEKTPEFSEFFQSEKNKSISEWHWLYWKSFDNMLAEISVRHGGICIMNEYLYKEALRIYERLARVLHESERSAK